MGVFLAIALISWVITKAVMTHREDMTYARQGQVPPRIQAKMAAYEAGSSATYPARPGAKGYWRELWHDSWDDLTERHKRIRAAKKAGEHPKVGERVRSWWRWAVTPLGERPVEVVPAQETPAPDPHEPAAAPVAAEDMPPGSWTLGEDGQRVPLTEGAPEAVTGQRPVEVASPQSAPQADPKPVTAQPERVAPAEPVKPPPPVAPKPAGPRTRQPAAAGWPTSVSRDVDRFRPEMLGLCAYRTFHRDGFDDQYCDNPNELNSLFCREHNGHANAAPPESAESRLPMPVNGQRVFDQQVFRWWCDRCGYSKNGYPSQEEAEQADKTHVCRPEQNDNQEEPVTAPVDTPINVDEVASNDALRRNLQTMQAAAQRGQDALAAAEEALAVVAAAHQEIDAAAKASADGVSAKRFDQGATVAAHTANDQINVAPIDQWKAHLTQWAEAFDGVHAASTEGIGSLDKWIDSEAQVASEGIDASTLQSTAA